MMISTTSPSRRLPIGPATNASGPLCLVQALVEKPEKRASVKIETVFPQGNYLRVTVIWALSAMPVPIGPPPMYTNMSYTKMSPGSTLFSLL
jgi:hypothetical protein